MKLRIDELKRKDYKQAIQFAIKGMHFEWYLDNKILLNLYGRYFWYLEKNRATHIYSVYCDEDFAGVLLAEIYGMPKKRRSFWETLYVKVFDFIQNTFYKGGVDIYNETTQELLAKYKEKVTPDGEIIFLAANPEIKANGIGSLLLNELEKDICGKTVFLHTDNACTYQFYEHRNFNRVGEKDILMKLGKKEVELKCLLYSKTIQK